MGRNKVLSFITGKSGLENVVRISVVHSSEQEVKALHRSRRTEEWGFLFSAVSHGTCHSHSPFRWKLWAGNWAGML